MKSSTKFETVKENQTNLTLELKNTVIEMKKSNRD